MTKQNFKIHGYDQLFFNEKYVRDETYSTFDEAQAHCRRMEWVEVETPEKAYKYFRRINGRRTLVAEVIKYSDGSAFVDFCHWAEMFDSADEAFGKLNFSLANMDAANGWRD